jgi:NitT/TauT family transport system substrate-binding protein
MQSAVSSNFKLLDRGESPLPAHFAQINRRDGFFLLARNPGPSFRWKELENRTLLSDHGLQPLVMLRYAAHCNGVDWSRVSVADAGAPEEMSAAFRNGSGDYIHLQAPASHQLEAGGGARIVAAVGEAMEPVAFSSLCASRQFLATAACRSFLTAFSNAKEWVRQSAPAEIADKEASFFPDLDTTTLAAAIRSYQALGCWEGVIALPRELFEQSVKVFAWAGEIVRRPAYDEICVNPFD